MYGASCIQDYSTSQHIDRSVTCKVRATRERVSSLHTMTVLVRTVATRSWKSPDQCSYMMQICYQGTSTLTRLKNVELVRTNTSTMVQPSQQGCNRESISWRFNVMPTIMASATSRTIHQGASFEQSPRAKILQLAKPCFSRNVLHNN